MNEQQQAAPRTASLWPLAALAALVGVSLVASCGGGGGPSSTGPKPVAMRQSTVLGLTVEVVERWVAYLADESTTSDPGGPGGLADYNGDLDNLDLVLHVSNMATKATVNVGHSADDLAFVRTVADGAHVFTVTDEFKDNKDWNLDLDMNDVVLVHYNASLGGPATFVAVLDTSGATKLVTVGDRVYFTDIPDLALVNGETTLNYVDAEFPETPMRVLNVDMGMTHTPQLLGQDEGLIFMVLDETVDGADLNGDLDMLDSFVLGLLDGTAPGAAMRTSAMAMRDALVPFRALDRAANDWLVSFLVNEADQDATNLNDLNDPNFGVSWQPTQCVGLEDVDTLDDTLHYLEFMLWFADPGVTPPVNTGLVGTDRVLAMGSGTNEYVATISTEADEGTCDLNLDGNLDDDILRWVKVESVVRPFGNSNNLLAVERTAGGIEGVSDFKGAFLCVVDEADDDRDHDGDGNKDRTLIAWLDPEDGNGATWEFDHCMAAQCPGIESVGTQWLGERMERDRFLLAFQESVYGASINDPFFRAKGGDTDTLDSVPTFARFVGAPTELDFPGPRIAVDDDNAGVVIVEGRAFYRVDEFADNTDWNKDGNKDDFVLFRTNVAGINNSFYIATLNTDNASAIVGGSDVGVAFVSDESADMRDLNKDGDSNDMVLQWLRL